MRASYLPSSVEGTLRHQFSLMLGLCGRRLTTTQYLLAVSALIELWVLLRGQSQVQT